MSSATTTLTESEILPHAVESIEKTNWNQVAHLFSMLKLPKRDLDRVDQLLERNRLGTATDSERAELEKYLRVGNFLDLMKARALRELGEEPQA